MTRGSDISTTFIDDQPICVECGLCCDGTLFPFVLIDADETPTPAMQQAPDTPRRAFQQPCPHYGGTCTVYQDRPRSCRVYACDLLRDVMAGDTTPSDARDLIARLKDLRDQFAAALGSTPASLRLAGRDLAEAARLAHDPTAFRAANARALAAHAAMEGMIAQVFISHNRGTPDDTGA